MTICYNCGGEFEFSENINQATGKPFKINPNGTEHDCYGQINQNRIKNKKYENTIRVEDENGNKFNAMLCKYLCKERVYRDESLFVEPKLKEVKTGIHHNYQRCYNIHVEKGNMEGTENFGIYSHALTWDELVFGMSESEVAIMKRAMPPNSKLRKYFDPFNQDPLVGKTLLDSLGMTQEGYDLMTAKLDQKEIKKLEKKKEEEKEDKEQSKLL